MNFKTRHIGAHGGNPASIIELTVENFDGSTITETITAVKDDLIDENLISVLKELVNELEEHNQKINDTKI